MAGSRPLPHDEALPIADALLDTATAGDLLRERLGLRGPFERVRIRYLAYEPGRRLTVQYETTGPDGVIDSGAVAAADDLCVFAYPHDPALGALADAAAVARRLGLPDATVTRLAWVPGQRAALRCGDAVLKVYADDVAVQAAVHAMRVAGDAVPTARFVGTDEARRVVAQELVPGRTLGLDDVVERGGDAGALARRLQLAVDVAALPVLDAGGVLAQADAPIDLAAFARPALADRLRAARARLAATAPVGTALVAAHGDYNVGQLIDSDHGLTVVDLDTLCAAPAAFDLAAYATNVVSGRAGDVERSQAALVRVVQGAGDEPDHLHWFVAATLLRRVDRAVRRLKRDWPERTDALVAAVEDAVARVG